MSRCCWDIHSLMIFGLTLSSTNEVESCSNIIFRFKFMKCMLQLHKKCFIFEDHRKWSYLSVVYVTFEQRFWFMSTLPHPEKQNLHTCSMHFALYYISPISSYQHIPSVFQPPVQVHPACLRHFHLTVLRGRWVLGWRIRWTLGCRR